MKQFRCMFLSLAMICEYETAFFISSGHEDATEDFGIYEFVSLPGNMESTLVSLFKKLRFMDWGETHCFLETNTACVEQTRILLPPSGIEQVSRSSRICSRSAHHHLRRHQTHPRRHAHTELTWINHSPRLMSVLHLVQPQAQTEVCLLPGPIRSLDWSMSPTWSNHKLSMNTGHQSIAQKPMIWFSWSCFPDLKSNTLIMKQLNNGDLFLSVGVVDVMCKYYWASR